MDQRDLLTLKPQLGAYIFSLLFVFTGVFSFGDDLIGKTFAGAPEPVEAVEANFEEELATFTSQPAPVLPAALVQEALENPKRVKPLPLQKIDTETLWLARCMYSETKRPEEQELVGWVVRNRVETQYRDKGNYEDVVLDDYQFSAFNQNSRKRRYYTNLKLDSQAPGWQNTLYMAYYVRHADSTLRPFSEETRHFYSEQSMRGRDRPHWVGNLEPITPKRPVELDPKRFRFYTGVY
ncbi:MAG TPA: hypothetical protein VKP65_17240 [Rhodothermales bacterium]|nr:hypothetical protein [Rhodothermales bacterium]